MIAINTVRGVIKTFSYRYCTREHMPNSGRANYSKMWEGKTMKSQRFSECGLLLIVALLGGCTTDASSTGRDTKLGHGERVGGQGGASTHLEKGDVVPDDAAERVGGQGGLEKPLEEGTA